MNIKTFCFNPFQENTYVVSVESGECMIIDCGAFYDSERQALTDYIDGNGLKPVMLVATHAHLDHNFGNDLITSRYGIHPWVSAKDEVLMSGLDRQSMLFLNCPLKHPQPSVGRYFADYEVIVLRLYRHLDILQGRYSFIAKRNNWHSLATPSFT